MFEIYNNRKQFWQWDSGQRLIVSDELACSEIHFCNGTTDCSLVCEIYIEDGLRLVNVPNILLQSDNLLRVFAYVCDSDENYTKYMQLFSVFARSKPDDYVYTETEVKTYESLSRRIDELEENGVSEEQIAAAVTKYLDENPIDSGINFTPGNALELTEDGTLNVLTATDAESDNTLPITSAAVAATVGNIEILLKTI